MTNLTTRTLTSSLHYQRMILHFDVACLICFPQYQSGNPNKMRPKRMKAIATNVLTYPVAVSHGRTAYEKPKPKMFFRATTRSIRSGEMR